MDKFNALIQYFKKKYPNQLYPTGSKVTDTYMTYTVLFPESFTPEIEAFFAAWDVAFNEGWINSAKKASEEYTKNVQEVLVASYTGGYNEGLSKGINEGFEEGVDTERDHSVIPSDAYDIEVFSVQPSQDHPSGWQAFVGYKFDLEGQPQFHFTQIGFTVPNLQPKTKINVTTEGNTQGNCKCKSKSCN